jgi:tetratricopeptide (TPR) repeat protein
MRARVAVAAVILTACSVGVYHATVPTEFKDLPWGEDAIGRSLVVARQLHERGRSRDALAPILQVLSEQPGNVDAQRLRQDILRSRGRTGLLRAEVAGRLERDPGDAVAHYLLGRLLPDSNEKLDEFKAATALQPDSMWPWLGLAFALRERRDPAALDIYAQLFAATNHHPIVAVAYAAALRDAGQFEPALRIFEQLRHNPDVPGTGELGVAQTLVAMDKRRESWGAMLLATRLRPFDPGLHHLLREWLRAGLPDEQIEQVFDILRENPARLQEFVTGDGGAVLLQLLQRMQQPFAARALLTGIGVSPRSPALTHAYRRLLLATGDVAGYLVELQQEVPAALLADETNQVRGIWRQLFDGPWCHGDPLADGATAVSLCRALAAVGQLAEVEQVAELAALRLPASRLELEAVRDEVRAEIAFESAVRRIVYQGYVQANGVDLDRTLLALREMSRTLLGRDVVGEVRRFSLSLIGEMIDPFATGLCQHLARYNKHLVLGCRSGGTVEGLLLSRVSVRELPADADLPLPGRCFEVIGFGRELRSLTGVAGGDLAGVALLNHYVIDLDAVREWAAGVADRRSVVAEDGNVLLTDPQPERVGPLDALDAAWRLAVLSPVQDSELDAAVLATIRAHERTHLCDSFFFLPVVDNLWRGLSLVFRLGLSGLAIEGEMEKRAELGALATSTHTELVLAHIADFLGEADVSPHARGFRDLATEVGRELIARGHTAAEVAPCRWHRLPMADVRAAAKALLARQR